MKHLIESQQLSPEIIKEIFAIANSFSGTHLDYNDALKGKIMAALFYEPSTRTRFSFESAMYRMGGEVITAESIESSSQSKGETLEDSIKVINNYADVIVLRHPEVGSAARAAAVSKVPVINAGDGNMGQHPTQSLIDLYTIHREVGRKEDLHVAFVGNLKYYRAPRSLSYLLGMYPNIRISFVSVPELKMEDGLKAYLDERGVKYVETEDLQSVIGDVDVLYQTRIAREWIATSSDYERLKGRYIITRQVADQMKEGSIIMHPLPRIDEIEVEVDESARAAYFKQAKYGLPVRMALLKYLLGSYDLKELKIKKLKSVPY